MSKSKAWLLVRSSVPMDIEKRMERLNELKTFAENKGMEVVGETYVQGRAPDVYQAVHNLFVAETQIKNPNVLLVRSTHTLGRDTVLLLKMRNELQEKGIQIKGMDGFEKLLYPETEEEKLQSTLLLQQEDSGTESENIGEQSFGGM